uniref:Serine-threonine/tyrosine-protein kinase catalytic domain-containing protein n=1 Tax=Panagrolaimus davidi TaxID=227884 RepID=A0A914P9I3_9BILA
MLRPVNCFIRSTFGYTIMLECWDENPENRPIFDVLQNIIKEVYGQIVPDKLAIPIKFDDSLDEGYESPNQLIFQSSKI